jgi:hypothetical protein
MLLAQNVTQCIFYTVEDVTIFTWLIFLINISQVFFYEPLRHVLGQTLKARDP